MLLEVDENLEKRQNLWRYMDLAKFVYLANTGTLWLARADTFRDAQEGRFPSEMRRFIEKAYEKFGDKDDSPVRDADDFQDFLLKNTFISCWHKNFGENMVMWEIYGRDTNSVAIQTTVARVEDSLNLDSLNLELQGLKGHSFLMKEVQYVHEDAIPGVLLYEECFFRKRPHFSHENEVRISLDTYDRFNPNKKTPFGIVANIDLGIFIENIFVHPDSQDWFLNSIDSLTKKYEIHAPVSRGRYGNN